MGKRQCYLFLCVNERPAGNPKGSCMHGGAGAVRDRLTELIEAEGIRHRVRLVRTSCLDNCSQGPVLAVYPGDIWYRRVGPDDVEEILRAAMEGQGPVARCVLPPEEFD